MSNDMNSGNAALTTYAGTIHPQAEYTPCDLQPGGRYPLPPAFELRIDLAHDESVILFGPNDTATRVKTLIQYGGRYLLKGLDVLRALAVVCRVGEPVWERSLDTQATYWRELLATAPTFAIPAPAPMTRFEMERFIDADANCQRVRPAFTEAANMTGRLVSDADLRDLIQRATDPEAAIRYYAQLRDGRSPLFTTSGPQANPARTTRTTHPVTQEA